MLKWSVRLGKYLKYLPFALLIILAITSKAAIAQPKLAPALIPPAVPTVPSPFPTPVMGTHEKWRMLTYGARPTYSFLFGSAWAVHDRGSPINGGLLDGTFDFQYQVSITPSTSIGIYHEEQPLYLIGDHSVVPLMLPSGKQIGSVDLSKRGANTSIKSIVDFFQISQGLLETKGGLLRRGVLSAAVHWSDLHGGIPGVGQDSTQWTPESGFVSATNQQQYWNFLLEYAWFPSSRFIGIVEPDLKWGEHVPGGVFARPQHVSAGIVGYVQYTLVPKLLDVAYVNSTLPSVGPALESLINTHASIFGIYIYGPRHTLVQLSAGNFFSNSDVFGTRALVCANPPTCSNVAPYLGGSHAVSYQIKFGFGAPVLSPL